MIRSPIAEPDASLVAGTWIRWPAGPKPARPLVHPITRLTVGRTQTAARDWVSGGAQPSVGGGPRAGIFGHWTPARDYVGDAPVSCGGDREGGVRILVGSVCAGACLPRHEPPVAAAALAGCRALNPSQCWAMNLLVPACEAARRNRGRLRHHPAADNAMTSRSSARPTLGRPSVTER